MLGTRNKKINYFEKLIQKNEIIPADDKQAGLDFLTNFFSEIRPGGGKKKEVPKKTLHRQQTTSVSTA